MAILNEDDRVGKRGQLILKSKKLGPEVATAIRLAAKQDRMSMGDWAAEVLWRAALQRMGKSPPPAPENLPALVTREISEGFARLAQQQDGVVESKVTAAVEAGLKSLQDGIKQTLDEEQKKLRRGRWRRR